VGRRWHVEERLDDERGLHGCNAGPDKLRLAGSWKFRTKVLGQDLTIRAVNGGARIVQDDLENTYDASFETACTYKP
jgi:hypothetical protein